MVNLLDTRTLVVVISLLATLLALFAYYISFRKEEMRSVHLWGHVGALVAAGTALIALRGIIPGFFSILVADTLIVIALVISFRALNVFLGRATADRVGWALAAATFAGLFGLTEIWTSAPGRTPFHASIMAFLFFRNAWVLHRHGSARRERSTLYEKFAFLLAGLLILARGVAVAILDPGDTTAGVATYFTPDPLRATSFMVFAAVLAITAIGVLWLEIERRERALSRMATIDALTGMANRTLFLDRLAHTLVHAERNRQAAAVMFLDLDRFKVVNDTFGHHAGDTLLKAVAVRVQKNVRNGDTVGRLGGDEFGIVLSTLARPEDAIIAARKVLDALAHPFEPDGRETYMTASIGIAIYPNDSDNPVDLLKNADIAMYRAKEQGRNNYQFYRPEMNARAASRLALETHLRGALERGEFLLHYQPKAALRGGRISGFEALLRWRHPQRGLVAPLEFISVLEDTGLIVPVGDWVIRSVCSQLRRWQDAGLAVAPVAVNLSARQFQRTDLTAMLDGALADSEIGPGLLEFEITESLLMGDAHEAARFLQVFRDREVRVAVDDFGTGYSNLAYLKRFPLHALKIDQAFVRDITTSADDAAIAISIINIAHSLNLLAVAEGVETVAQLDLLRAHGCDEMQGYLFAKPMPPEECAQFLVGNRRLPGS